MSSLDPRSSSRRGFLGMALLLAAGTTLAGCQVRPLYGTLNLSNSETPTAAELAAIDIEPIDLVGGVDSDGSSDDVKRVLYNELTFGFEHGGNSPEKRYRLKIIADVSTMDVGVEKLSDVPASYTLTLNTSFVLTDINTDKTVTTGRSFITTSYDFSSQRFANIRARKDAAQRAAKNVAQDIQTRLAGYFASHPAPKS